MNTDVFGLYVKILYHFWSQI